jgi:hypothetical protein
MEEWNTDSEKTDGEMGGYGDAGMGKEKNTDGARRWREFETETDADTDTWPRGEL